MKKSGTALLRAMIFLMALMLLSGCKDLKDVKESTVSVDKKGVVTEALVEDFSAERYDGAELEKSVKELVQAYNSQAGSNRVTLQELEVKDGIAKVFLRFETAGDYRKFNQVDFFSGTVKDALKEGYDFSGTFLDAEGKEVDGSKISSQNQEAQVMILKEPLQAQVPGNILYVSKNMEILGKNQAKLPDDTGIPYENAQAITNYYGYVIYSVK